MKKEMKSFECGEEKNYFGLFISCSFELEELQIQWKQLNVITNNVIIWLMLSDSLCPKVITLSGFHC